MADEKLDQLFKQFTEAQELRQSAMEAFNDALRDLRRSFDYYDAAYVALAGYLGEADTGSPSFGNELHLGLGFMGKLSKPDGIKELFGDLF
jgi:hypothetical protein